MRTVYKSSWKIIELLALFPFVQPTVDDSFAVVVVATGVLPKGRFYRLTLLNSKGHVNCFGQ